MLSQVFISVSILSANLGKLDDEIAKIENSLCDYIHIDVMDGHFVPNITFGTNIIKYIKSRTKLPLDVHLMISNPDEAYQEYIEAGADILTFHAEASKNPKLLIESIKALNTMAGISIKPSTEAGEILHLIDLSDLVLIMSVEPGYAGQSFISDSLVKINTISHYVKTTLKNQKLISVDGGINQVSAEKVLKAGANMLVSGSFLFKNKDFNQALLDLKNFI
ncbi:MAG: ribulose-phosphate 3-epimerase [Rickettsiaceae bacterium]|nr:ribulose-phosphate 3-epimerase [Rickettsiaceae bacterium]